MTTVSDYVALHRAATIIQNERASGWVSVVAEWMLQHAEEHSSYDCHWEPCAAVVAARQYLAEADDWASTVNRRSVEAQEDRP